MTGPNPSPLLSGDPSAGLAEEIRGNAGRLGLQWALLSATVTEANSASNLFARVLLDGDPEDSKARSIVGEVLTGDRVTVELSPYDLGRGLERVRTAEIPRYADILGAVFEKTGWKADDFDVYRVRMRYPPMPVSVMVRHEMPVSKLNEAT